MPEHMVRPNSVKHEPIAIIGMSCRFPGSVSSPADYWQMLRSGRSGIVRFSDEELRAAGVDAGTYGRADYVNAGAVLDDIELFDLGFFGFDRKDLAMMDPQHRLLLQGVWEALEDAGYGSRAHRGEVGLFAGCGVNDYFIKQIITNDGFAPVDDFQGTYGDVITGNEKDYLVNRIAYLLNLTGPAVTVQSACSTSMVAAHYAVQSLRLGECDVAVAGGVAIKVPHRAGYRHYNDGMKSVSGECRPFDAQADGTILSNGLGLVVLKPLRNAVRDGDHIYCVIKGSAINNDGDNKVSFHAPGVSGQERVIVRALENAQVEPQTIQYLEAHGTGTKIGDHIEITAATKAFSRWTKQTQFCALGSVKSNIGHSEAAAGVASLMKAALSLYHREMPPTLNFTTPNPSLSLAASPFAVNAALRPWPAGLPRRAAVNSFGMGGTNAHMILEEAPEATPTAYDRAFHVLPISARTADRLRESEQRLADHLTRHPEVDLADVAYTLAVGREAFSHRRVVIARDAADAVGTLTSRETSESWREHQRLRDVPVAFLLPADAGSELAQAGQALYESERHYREAVDACCRAATERLHLDVDRRLAPAADRPRDIDDSLRLFIFEYALGRLWIAHGVKPHSLLGQGVGEYAAACLTGTLTVPDALEMLAQRVAVASPTRLAPAIAAILDRQRVVFLEIGPGTSLSAQVRRLPSAAESICIPSMSERTDGQLDDAAIESAVARLWLGGVMVEWAAFYADAGCHRTPLPTYPFEKQRHWIDRAASSSRVGIVAIEQARLTMGLAEDEAEEEAEEGVEERRARRARQVSYAAPASPVEEDLAAIWARLLYVEAPGIEDDFFALGGQSLLALELIRRIGERFTVDIELMTVFAHPTIRALAAVIERAMQAGERHTLPQLTPDVERAHEPFPLTETQEAYWVGRKSTFEMGNVAIHGYQEVTCRRLDIHRLEQAWTKLVIRHGMLRAVIREDATQRILPNPHNEPFPIVDLRGLPAATAETIIQRVRDGMSHEVRPLDRWPLFDFRVVLTRDDEAILVMSLEVMNVDEGSLLILSEELGQLYQKPDAVIAPLPISFRDYVLGQRELVPAALVEKSWEYWNAILDDLPPGPELPAAISLKEVTTPRFTRRTFSIGTDRWSAVQRFARGIKVTPSGLLLAAYAEILARWSNSSRFTINIPVYNRLPLHPRVNDLVGVFTAINLLVVEGPRDTGFAQRAVQIQQRLWRDLDHRFISGVKLRREIGRRRAASGEAAFPYVFTNIIGLGRRSRTSGLGSIGDITYAISQTPQVLLDCQFNEEAGALYGCWDSVDEVFPAGMLDEMFRAFEGVINALGSGQDNVDVLIEDAVFPAHRRAERAAINDTDTTIRESTVPEELAAQARSGGDRAAVITQQREISYAQLDAMAHALAASLIERGAAANELIAVYTEKGWPQIVAVCGVLLAGAAYLPIDPSAPKERIELYLRRGRVRLLVTESHLAKGLAGVAAADVAAGADAGVDADPDAGAEADVITIDRFLDADAALPRRAASCAPTDLCYVLYTSGSTGEPKGVMIEQRSVTNRMADIAARFALGPADRTIAITPLQHDLSVFDMFGPLLTDGAIVVPDAARALDPAHWVELIAGRKVTVWNSVPAFMDLLVGYLERRSEAADAVGATSAASTVDTPEASDATDLSSLRLIMLSGDRIPPKLYFRIRRAIPHARVVSLGGPTEITVWDIGHPLHDVAPDIKRIPYGYPLANSKCDVLDEELRDCPVWVTGDLYSSGIGLARGYWDDEALTRAAFITHPRTGARIYRTGDLGRYLPDGAIDIIGRRDFQVKVNGYRVECEEIEALLNRHPHVARSAVTTYQHPAGGHALVAYIVPNSPSAPASAATGSGTAASGATESGVTGSGATDSGAAGTQLEHLQFRLGQPGIRRFNGGHETVALAENGRLAEHGRLDGTEIPQFLTRRSYRRFQAGTIPSADFAQMLGCLRQLRIDETPFPKYRYGSAGNLYPVQTYVHVRPGAIAEVAGGVYYYHPAEDALVWLAGLDQMPAGSVGPENRHLLDAASFVVFLIADLDAIRPLYAEASLRYCAIEAGLIAQLLEMSCAGTAIGLTQIGAIKIDTLNDYFQLGPSHEVMHALVGGRVVRAETVDAYKHDLVEKPSLSIPPPDALPADLERYLASKLSRAVVPRRFVMLDALPLTRNGKIDRDALPAPQVLPGQGAVVYREPQNDIERALVEIWQSVLGLDRVGVQDNFFDLGGNSLLLIKANREILERLRLEISLVEMFSHPTIQSLAAFLSSRHAPARMPAAAPAESARVRRRKNRSRTGEPDALRLR
jgi:amino acid adenylation domain-containing protein